MKWYLIVPLCLLLSAAGTYAAGTNEPSADPNAPAEFVVTDQVLRPAEKVPPLGIINWGRTGANEWAANNFINNSGNEPIWWRQMYRVMDSGPNWFEMEDAVGTSGYQVWSSGFLSGADLRIYRLVDKEGKLLPTIKDGKRYEESVADHVVPVGVGRVIPEGAEGFPDGGWIVNNGVGRVYATANTPKIEKWDYVVVSRRLDPFDMRWVNPRIRGNNSSLESPKWPWVSAEKVSFAQVAHPEPIPTEMVDPGETCLQITAAAGAQSINQRPCCFIGTETVPQEAQFYGQLEPGKQYCLEVWLRQEGLGDNGTVAFAYNNGGYPNIHQTFQVTGEWKKYVYSFVGPERPTKVLHFGHQFSFTGPGLLWMDNCRIFRADKPSDMEKPYVPNATVLDELLATQPATGPKGVHRNYIINHQATMSGLLSLHNTSQIDGDRLRVVSTEDMTIAMGLFFDLRTGDSPQTRMRPWFTIQHILHSEQDWLNFIEYLAAPYEPAHDSPQSKPWAYKRYQQRGVGTPWTDEFSQITVELGNETWHNGKNSDWLGFGLYCRVFQGGREYGLFGRYLIENMRSSPYWKTENLDKKIRFSLGANYDGRVDKDGQVRGYGEEAMQVCPCAAVLGHANYVGPKWELGEKSGLVFDDHAVQSTLLGFVAGLEQNQAKMAGAREALAKSHDVYDIAAYEGGPGGYSIHFTTADQKLNNEKQGKSLAMGVATLDTWLGSYILGWTDQMFCAYAQGNGWTSHTPLWDGFRPSCSWQALTLRNRFASGDLMAVNEKTNPTILWGKQTCPLIGIYAMRDGNRWSVFVLSRKLTGATPITLHLPFHSAKAITLHKLTGDPRDNNMKKMNIAIQSQDIPNVALKDGLFAVNDATGDDKNGMPPGSIYLYVFEDTTN